MSGSGDDPKRPRMTSGPSTPVHGEPQRKPFGRDTTPGRDDAPTHHSPTSHAVHFSLPTGGGALRSIGETVSANPFTGAASVSVPIATSPGRGGFGPALSLRYSSGLGNGPFGLGWQLDLPSISRKTEKGLPEYRDADPELHRRDTFIFAGAEDLVHELDDVGEVWSQQRDGFVVHRFRPRVESDFTRIERWTAANGDTHWRTISPNNVTRLTGVIQRSYRRDEQTGHYEVASLPTLEFVQAKRGVAALHEGECTDLCVVDQAQPQLELGSASK